MADFFAVQNGSKASGYLVANGNVYPAVSGSSKLQSIPQGNYTYGKDLALDPKQYRSMTDGSNPKNFRKFHIWGTGPNGTIWDPKLKRYRVGIEFHYDGGAPGTAGCIGYQDPAAKNALIADKDKSVHVQYLQSDAEVRAAIEKKLGHKVDWSKVKAPKKGAAAAASARSTTKKGNKVKRAAHTVRAGRRQRHTAHRRATLTGGGVVTQGSRSIFVGRQRQRVAGVDHLTSDGSPLATGEGSILFT
jgi:hypothetical protein